MGELQYATTKLKVKKSLGPDKISNEMMLNFGLATKTKLTEINNHCWVKGTVLHVWKKNNNNTHE